MSPRNEQVDQLHNNAARQEEPEDIPGGSKEQSVEASSSPHQPTEPDLHRFCAEGKLDEVRAMLSRSLEGVESLGPQSFQKVPQRLLIYSIY